jgi:hypothetical protein
MAFRRAMMASRRERMSGSGGASCIAPNYDLTLAGFEPGVLLIDDIDPALAADDAAVLVTLLERTERVANLHDTAFGK